MEGNRNQVALGLSSEGGICYIKEAASFGTGGRNDPVAVPEKIIGLTLFLDFFDRCHSLTSLYLPQAALGSLPTGLLHFVFQIPPLLLCHKKNPDPFGSGFSYGNRPLLVNQVYADN